MAGALHWAFRSCSLLLASLLQELLPGSASSSFHDDSSLCPSRCCVGFAITGVGQAVLRCISLILIS